MGWLIQLFGSNEKKIADLQAKQEKLQASTSGAEGNKLVKINAQIEAIKLKIKKLQEKVEKKPAPKIEKSVE